MCNKISDDATHFVVCGYIKTEKCKYLEKEKLFFLQIRKLIHYTLFSYIEEKHFFGGDDL